MLAGFSRNERSAAHFACCCRRCRAACGRFLFRGHRGRGERVDGSEQHLRRAGAAAWGLGHWHRAVSCRARGSADGGAAAGDFSFAAGARTGSRRGMLQSWFSGPRGDRRLTAEFSREVELKTLSLPPDAGELKGAGRDTQRGPWSRWGLCRRMDSASSAGWQARAR